MKRTIYTLSSAFAVLLFLGACVEVLAQGRGGGRPSGGPPAGAGRTTVPGPPAGVGRTTVPGPPAGVGVDRGLGRASERSAGRSDSGLGTASDRSGGRSDTGLDRARMASVRSNAVNDSDLNRFRGLSRRFGSTPEEMRELFETALLDNPNLRFGHFVAAHVVADNLGSRFPNITADNILIGLAEGNNFGRTLRNLGLTKQQARDGERFAKDIMKETRNDEP